MEMTSANTITKTLTAREYLRVSKDRTGRMASPARQHRENSADAKANGITLGTPYREVKDVSASRYSTKTRDAFDDLISDLSTGAFGADVLYLWEASRGSRKVGEWDDLLNLCEARGVLIRIKTHGRTYDPRNGRDRRTLLEDAVDSEYESYKTSTRIRGTAADMAADGRPTGFPPFGYRAVHDVRTGRLVTWEPDDHAPLISELFHRIAAGHSLKGIAADWKARRIVNGKGTPFSAQHLRQTAMRAAYAGLRSHHGSIVATGRWTPIVSPELYHTVQRILTDPDRKTTRGGRAVHEFTMIMRCGECGGPIIAADRRGPKYLCRDHSCIKIARPEVDAEVTGEIFAYLRRTDVYEALSVPEESPELLTVWDDLAAARAALREAEAAEPESIAEARMFARTVETLSGKVRALEERERELSAPSALLRLIEPGADVAARWKDMPISARREAARILLSPGYLGEVRIHRTPRPGHPVPVGERLEWSTGA